MLVITSKRSDDGNEAYYLVIHDIRTFYPKIKEIEIARANLISYKLLPFSLWEIGVFHVDDVETI